MISRKNQISKLNRLLAILISMGYFFASTPIHIHDEHAHVDNDLAHTSEIHETDSCHNYIYHGKSSSGCENHDHASTYELECLICHHFVAGQKLVAPTSSKIAIVLVEEQTPVYEIDIVYIYSGFSNPLRGPPAIA